MPATSRLTDPLFERIRVLAQQALGRTDICIGTEADCLLFGLPLPALCLRYLFQTTIFPLSRITGIVGPEGSAKSSLAFEIMRWHMVAGGGAFFAENEHKDSPELRQGLLRWNEAWLGSLDMLPTYSMAEWQSYFTTTLRLANDECTKAGGPGLTRPIVYLVDSLMGTGTESQIQKIMEEGYATQDYARGAGLLKDYFGALPRFLGNTPFSVVFTNHLKPGADYAGRPTRNTPGGKAPKFYESFELEMVKAPHSDVDLVDYGGLRTRITLFKNCAGPSHKQIYAELLWWLEYDEQGFPRQHSAWDWHTSSIELLLSFQNLKGKQTVYKALQDVCDLNVPNRGERKVWSRVLGIPQNEPVLWRAAGQMLEARPDLLWQIYPILFITPRREFVVGRDYRDQQREAREAGTCPIADLYARAVSLPAAQIYPQAENMPAPETSVFDGSHTPFIPQAATDAPAEQEGSVEQTNGDWQAAVLTESDRPARRRSLE